MKHDSWSWHLPCHYSAVLQRGMPVVGAPGKSAKGDTDHSLYSPSSNCLVIPTNLNLCVLRVIWAHCPGRGFQDQLDGELSKPRN